MSRALPVLLLVCLALPAEARASTRDGACDPPPPAWALLFNMLEGMHLPAGGPKPGTRRLPSEEGAENWHGVNQVGDHLWVGAQLGTERADDDTWRKADATFLKELGIGHVVDMRIEGRSERAILAALDIGYDRFRVVDHFAPSLEQLVRAVRIIQALRAAGIDVLIHCHVGKGRSPAVAVAVLMDDGLSLVEALRQVEASRTISVRWNVHDLLVLRRYEALLQERRARSAAR